MNKEFAWHNIPWEEAVKNLNSNYKRGLNAKEVKSRQDKFGKNLLPEGKRLSKIIIFLEQFKSPLMYILVIAGIVVLFFREYADAVVIFSAIFLNSVVGFIQENKANDSLAKLKKVVKIEAKVIREGNEKLIDSSEIVVGDIILLDPGCKVPADGRIIENNDLKVNEMILTGEWLPADKKIDILSKDISLADRDNMVYMGTIVEDGKAKFLVTAIGFDTEIGKIASLVKETKQKKTPLQRKLSSFAKVIGVIIIFISIAIVIEGLFTGANALEIFITAVAVAVAAIPEGLPIATTVILALGMQKILKQKGLVRKLSSAETLGSTSIIATDKTGTLTEGKMQVAEILVENKINNDLALEIAVLCNDAFIENPEDVMKRWIVRGRPTDKALLLAGMHAGIDKRKLEQKIKVLAEMPFNTVNKYLARAFSIKGKKHDIIYFSGAPEKLLEMAKYYRDNKEERIMDEKSLKKFENNLEDLASKGLRVIAVAYKNIDNLENLFTDIVFVGMIALKDPIRKDVKGAIKKVKQAGIKIIMVTGDHRLTAKAVALELGFKIKEDNIMEGKDLNKLSDKQFENKLEDIQIYARVEPKHKLRIIQAWQNKGEIIAMTGDGINDAPALRKADIGVALGSGTEVAKEVSDLVLLSDKFNIIVAAIEEGRAIIDNIRKVITYLLSSSFTETILVALAILFGFPLPITAVQILWANIIEDGLPDIALAFEPKEEGLMNLRPQSKNSPLLTGEMKAIIFVIGILSDIFLLGLFFWLIKYSSYDLAHIRTMIFAALSLDSLFFVFSCKSLRHNIWHTNHFFSNKFLIYAWVFGIAGLLAAVYVPIFQSLLKTVPLTIVQWIFILILSLVELILIEFTKWIFIKNKLV
jgi:Ca2+-transporting ATPase